MKNTTIALNRKVKEELQQFGTKGESYSDIVYKLLKSAKERQINDILMDETDTISAKEALAKAKKRWQE
jgi:predicted CopG family antitoxin